VTTRDAAELAVPAVELRKLAQRGGLKRAAYGLYRFDDIPRTGRDEFMEAGLRVGPDAYLSHDAVLALHDLGLANPRRIRVGVPRRARPRLPASVEIVQRNLDPVDLTTYEGIPSTTVARALLDCRDLIMVDRLVGAAEEAAKFYAATFPDSSVDAVHRAPADYPSGKMGDVLTVEFSVMGLPCIGLNGGPGVEHNWAFSFQVATVDQAETDRYWNAIVGNGGEESQCGWCKDRWGLSWQITPRALTEAIANADRAVAKRAFEAMMEMGKIDIAAIEAAIKGGSDVQ